MKKFIVGDLHGSYDKLMKVLDTAKFSDSDVLYCTGDICDRGPKIYETLDFVVSLGNRFKSVFGNHDIWMYHYVSDTMKYHDEYECWSFNGGKNTIKAIEGHEDRFKEFTSFYEKMPYIIEEDNFRIIHTPTFNHIWNRCNIDLHNVTLGNLEKTGLLIDPVYDGELFDRDIIYSTSYFGCTIAPEDFGKNAIDFGHDKKLTIVGHTPLEDGILYDKDYNIIGVDTAGFCSKEKYGFDGYITLLDVDEMKCYDSRGKIINLS